MTQKSPQTREPENRLWGTLYPEEKRTSQRISCFFHVSPNLFPRPLRHPQEGAALLLGCAGWGEQRRIPSPFPFGGTRKIGNKRASQQPPALHTEAVGRHGTPSQASQGCWVVQVLSWVQRVHSVVCLTQGCQTASLTPALKSFMNKADVSNSLLGNCYSKALSVCPHAVSGSDYLED